MFISLTLQIFRQVMFLIHLNLPVKSVSHCKSLHPFSALALSSITNDSNNIDIVATVFCKNYRFGSRLIFAYDNIRLQPFYSINAPPEQPPATLHYYNFPSCLPPYFIYWLTTSYLSSSKYSHNII